ncbi:hypothetical protein DFP73DRAFT_621851 [Morchella snyderi]|nr:hypothetical protein DFP73DRAFT_621851 [Morchella snyderi]
MRLFHVLLACTITVAVSATPVPDDGGPNYLPPRILMPNYIVPINQSNPNFPGGTKYEGELKYTGRPTDQIRSLIGWDIPADAPKYCTIGFELSTAPGQAQNTWKTFGGGGFNVYILSSNPAIDYKAISWNNRPDRFPPKAQWSVKQPTTGGKAVVGGSPVECSKLKDLFFVELASDEQSLLYLKWFELTSPPNGITLEMRNSLV